MNARDDPTSCRRYARRMIADSPKQSSSWAVLIRLIVGAAAAFVVLAVLVIARFDPLLDFDLWVSRAAYSVALAHPLWRATMSAVTTAGSTTVIVPLAVLGCAILLAYRRWRQVVF